MVAEGTHKHLISRSIIVNESSPVIDELGQLTTLRLMARSLATLKLPQSILFAIVMDTLHSGHHMVSRTLEEERLVPLILIPGPEAFRESVRRNAFAKELKTSIL